MLHPTFPLAITATLASLVLAGCGEDEPTGADDPASTPASETSAPTPSDATSSPTSSEPTETTSTAITDVITVPVYFVGQTPQGPRLYAEQRDVESDNPADEALALLAAGDALDPDYRSLVPADSVAGASFEEGFYALELSDESWTARPAGMSKAEAQLAVQQVIYTLQGQTDGVGGTESGDGVDFYLDGQHVTFLGLDGTVEPAPELEVRALVNVTAPAEGATVSGSFTASGAASSFEATVPWEVRDESGEVVVDGFSTAEGWIDGLYPWEAEVDVSALEPGTYTFAALTDDPSGGEGPGPTEDTKTIVVE